MALQLYDIACLLMFAVELYHCIAHIMIMCGVRTLPRRDLVKIRYYFIVDTASVFISSFLLTGRLKWLAVIQMAQHLYYFITWDKSYMAKRIIDWSSLDWFRGSKELQLDSTLGTLFDVLVHLAMMYVIGIQLDLVSVVIAILVAQAALYGVIFNPKFAWSNPHKMPAWVQKRLGKLALEQE